MDARLQRRVQRYGWDLAAADYEPLWERQLALVQRELITSALLVQGQRVLDVACGTGLVSFAAARAVGTQGSVLGVDLSGRMVDDATRRADVRRVANARFERMDAERLDLPDASFDVALCSLGLMYLPDPLQAVREMLRVLRPGGRMVLSVWGERLSCGWSALFAIVDDEVESEVCPLFFHLGQLGALARLARDAGLEGLEQHRLSTTLEYPQAQAACRAAFVGGPVALAWSRFDDEVRARVCNRYLQSIDRWRNGRRYRVPGEFVVVAGAKPLTGGATTRGS